MNDLKEFTLKHKVVLERNTYREKHPVVADVIWKENGVEYARQLPEFMPIPNVGDMVIFEESGIFPRQIFKIIHKEFVIFRWKEKHKDLVNVYLYAQKLEDESNEPRE